MHLEKRLRLDTGHSGSIQSLTVARVWVNHLHRRVSCISPITHAQNDIANRSSVPAFFHRSLPG
jgi:hypothetical protein